MNQSAATKQFWNNLNIELEKLDTYSLSETVEMLRKGDYYTNFQGQGKNRTMVRENPKLFKSIYRHSDPLERKMRESGRYASAYNFSHRITFIVDFGAEIEKLRCKCGKRYSWTGYCRGCSEAKNSFLRMTEEEKKARNLKAGRSMRQRVSEELRREGKSPRYNVESIQMLDKFAVEKGLRLRHAEKGGEKYLGEVGYWLDGYDEDRNVVVEVDEPYHFRKELILSEKGIERHRQIQELLGCSVYRIYFNKRTNRTVLYNSPDMPDNWDVNKGIELTEFVGFAKNGTKQYRRYAEGECQV